MKSLILALLPLAACNSQGAFSSAYPGNYLILVDKTDNLLQVVEPNSGWVRDDVPTDPGPRQVAGSYDGQYAVTANYGGVTPGHTLDVYSMPMRRMDYTVDISPYTCPYGIASLDRRTNVLVTSETSNAVLEVDITSRSVVRAMNTGGQGPRLLVIAGDQSRVYTTNMGSGTVSAIDLTTGQVVKTVPVGNEPEGIDLSRDGELWIGLRKDDKLVVLDAATLEKKAEIPCAHIPTRLKCTPNGDRVLVANNGSGDVAVFDARARREIVRIALAPQAEDGVYPPEFAGGEHPGPADLLIEPRGRYAYVSESRTNRLIAIDLEKLFICGSIQAGNGPCGLGWVFFPEMSPFAP